MNVKNIMMMVGIVFGLALSPAQFAEAKSSKNREIASEYFAHSKKKKPSKKHADKKKSKKSFADKKSKKKSKKIASSKKSQKRDIASAKKKKSKNKKKKRTADY